MTLPLSTRPATILKRTWCWSNLNGTMHMKLASTQVATMRSFVTGIPTLFKVVIISKVSDFRNLLWSSRFTPYHRAPTFHPWGDFTFVDAQFKGNRLPAVSHKGGKKKRAHVRVSSTRNTHLSKSISILELVFSLCKRYFHWHGTVLENREIMRHGPFALVRPVTSPMLVLLTSVSPVFDLSTGGAFRVLLAWVPLRNSGPFWSLRQWRVSLQPTSMESCFDTPAGQEAALTCTSDPEWFSSKAVFSGMTSSSCGNVSSSDVSSSSECFSCSTESASQDVPCRERWFLLRELF